MILEAKQVRDISDIRCVYGTSGGGAFRILTSQSRIGEMPHRFLAQVPPDPSAPDAPMFWVHEWVANYHELRVATSLESPEELAGVARDVGIQLGRGHTRAIASPLDSQLRRAQLTLLDELESDVRETSRIRWRSAPSSPGSGSDPSRLKRSEPGACALFRIRIEPRLEALEFMVSSSWLRPRRSGAVASRISA